jgi:Ni/Co efflux regulator RcnB
VVYSFYRTEFVAGRCPPGLARKDIGCLPPGHAKRLWGVGAALPQGLTFYPLPAALVAQLSPAPQGYQYVRVDNDILLIALGTRVVTESLGSIAALQDADRPLVVESDRSSIAAYYRDDYLAGNCPAGLVRSDSGCRTKSLWALGEPLDPAVTYEVLPDPLLAQLSPPPDGYQYIRVGDHILLMLVETRVIRADVVDLTRLPVGRAIAVAPAAAMTTVVPGRVEYLGGGCPPGLAKKHNGCLPPGHAK